MYRHVIPSDLHRDPSQPLRPALLSKLDNEDRRVNVLFLVGVAPLAIGFTKPAEAEKKSFPIPNCVIVVQAKIKYTAHHACSPHRRIALIPF